MRHYLPMEDAEQKAVVNWLSWHKVLFCHVPNGGSRHIREAVKFKQLGVMSGIPDILIFDAPPAMPNIHSVAIELKRQKGSKTSENQKQWLWRLSERGWYTAICYGADEAIKKLETLGYGRR